MLQIIKYIIFFPFAVLYRIIIYARYLLYKNGLKKVHHFKTPIISVGNITVGGTGKTPMVHFIANELKLEFPKIAIISRGYGRKSKGFQLVHNGEKLLLDSEIAGDEPFLLSNLLGNCIVAVDENRINAIEKIETEYNPDLIILDDGFQQLGIRKSVDIVLINASKPFSEMKLLPFGFGREPLSKLNRADIIVYTKTKEFNFPDWNDEIEFSGEMFSSKYETSIWEFSKSGYNKIENVPENLYAFCGIADPNSFRYSLKENNINPIGFVKFKDHEPYSQKIMDQLSLEISNKNTKNVITTEKDIVKLSDEFIENHHIFTLRIQHKFLENEKFIQKLKSTIKEKS